ncbi:uncharacterized protein LOC108339184 [Vigna angularis]|uniref:uncharacterized protein LOC108339184 n=1 Tax=Phaseolus angularis TaxID=3914 RepID=UPI00080A68C5|nr:uncharacterized protein LOC108339184 [Vigna angularis]
MIETAKRVEMLETNLDRVVRPQKGSSSETRFQKKPYLKPQQPVQGSVKCYECDGAHYTIECPKLFSNQNNVKKYFSFNKPGHFAFNCPENKIKIRPQQPSPSGEKPKATGRIFSITREEAPKLGNLVLGMYHFFGKCMHVLFDSRATHSFVSSSCLEEFCLPVSDLGCGLVVSTPASG